MGNVAAAIPIGPLVSPSSEFATCDYQRQRCKTAKPAVRFRDGGKIFGKKDEINAAKLAASKKSATKDPIVGCTEKFDAVPAGNTAVTEETGLGGGM